MTGFVSTPSKLLMLVITPSALVMRALLLSLPFMLAPLLLLLPLLTPLITVRKLAAGATRGLTPAMWDRKLTEKAAPVGGKRPPPTKLSLLLPQESLNVGEADPQVTARKNDNTSLKFKTTLQF